MKLEDKKRMAAKAFAAFFLFMAAAGGLSRAAAAMTVPLADTRTYQEGRLNLDLTEPRWQRQRRKHWCLWIRSSGS